MNVLNFSSWSLNLKIFVILLSTFVLLELINLPLSIETFTQVNRQTFQQVVTESALRQKAAIDEDFVTALTLVEQFELQTIPYLSVSQWLTRSDPETEGFDVNATQTKASAERAIESEILSLAPTLFQQAWLIDANGQVIANIANFTEPRYTVGIGEYVDASETPAHRSGKLLGETTDTGRLLDLVVEDVEEVLSLQLIVPMQDSNGFIGTLVVELNNISIVLSNLRLTGVNNESYSFVASPENANAIIKLDSTPEQLINLDTQATRSSLPLQEAQSYLSGDRSVIGFYTPLFEDFRNDVILVVELDERIILGNIPSAVITTTGPVILLTLSLIAIVLFLLNLIVIRPLKAVTQAVRTINSGDFQSPLLMNTNHDEIGDLAETVIELREQLIELTDDMSARIEARNRDLQITQEISRVAISETNLDSLMNRVVNLIVERFESIYHAQIFLIQGSYAVLQASTGEAGQQLLTRGHRLGIGSLSVIGQVTQQNQTIIARDTATSEVHRRNEFLQETRAELAIPMRLGNRIIGVLDVQSTISDAFDEEAVAILETMTDQLAIAIENTRLYDESTRRLQELDQATRQRTQHNWQDFMYSQRVQQLATHAGAKVVYDFSALREQAIQTRRFVIGDKTDRDTIPIAMPITIRDLVLGVIEWEIEASQYNPNRVLLAEELVARLAVSLDNARLVQAGRQTAANERIINTISAKISGQSDIDQILQTAIQEVGQALRAPQVNIRLHQSNMNGGQDHENGHQPSTDNT